MEKHTSHPLSWEKPNICKLSLRPWPRFPEAPDAVSGLEVKAFSTSAQGMGASQIPVCFGGLNCGFLCRFPTPHGRLARQSDVEA